MSDTVEYIVKLRDEMSSTLDAIRSHTESMNRKMQESQSIVSQLRNNFIALAAVNAVRQFAGTIFDTGVQIEQLGVAFTTMLGSKDAATQMMADITKFAKETPFELTDVATSSKQLLAFGIEQQKVISTLKSLGDVAAGISAPIGDIAYLYGTINTQGRAMTMDINQFANRGIPIWKELEKITGKNGLALRKFVEEGKVDFKIIEQAFQNMSGEGGKFFNLMEAQAKTTGGTWSNLKDTAGQLANDFFVLLQPAINSVIQSGMALIQNIRDLIGWMREHQAAVKAIAGAIAVVVGAYILYNTQMQISALMATISTIRTFALLVATDGLAAALYAAGIAGTVAWAAITLGLSVVVAGLIYAYQKSVWFRGAIHGIGEVVKSIIPLFKGLGEIIIGALTFNPKMFLQGVEDAKKGLVAFATVPATFSKAQNDYIIEDVKQNAREKVVAAKGVTVKDPAQNFDKKSKDVLTDAKKAENTAATTGGSSKAAGNKTTTINVTIQKMVDGGINIHTTTLREGTAKVKEQLTNMLLSVVNDSQLIADS